MFRGNERSSKDKLKRFGLFARFGEKNFATIGEAVNALIRRPIICVNLRTKTKRSQPATIDRGAGSCSDIRPGNSSSNPPPQVLPEFSSAVPRVDCLRSRIESSSPVRLRYVSIYLGVATKPMLTGATPQNPTSWCLSLVPLTTVVPMPFGSSTDWYFLVTVL